VSLLLLSDAFTLFPPTPTAEPSAASSKTVPAAKCRLRPIDRHLGSTSSLDELLPPDDLARLVWQYVRELDLTDFYTPLRAVEGVPGRNATDPALFVALWL
jgi:hypothetical protein